MSISQMCINFTCLLSSRLIVSGFVAGLLFFTLTPSMTNIEVALVSAMACEAAIVRALKYCGMGLPNIRLAISASDVGALFGPDLFVAAFNMVTVMSSFATSLSYMALMFLVGSRNKQKLNFYIYLLYLFLPPPSKGRELQLVHPLGARVVPRVDPLPRILTSESFLVVHLAPMSRASLRSVAILNVESTQKTDIPICILLHNVGMWGVGRLGCLFGESTCRR
jgi:hypothetical protein